MPVARDGDPLLALRVHGTTAVLDDRSLAGVDPVVAAALRVARDHGAPVAPVLVAATEAAVQRRRLAADVAAAVAPARTVARSLVALPVVAVPVLGTIAGTDLVGFYLGDPAGRAVGVVVLAVVAAAAGWLRVLVASVGRPVAPPGTTWPVLPAVVVLVVVGPVPALACALAGLVRNRRRPDARPPDPHLAEAVDLVAVAVAAGHDLATAMRIAADHLPAALPTSDTRVLAGALRRLGLALVLQVPGPSDRRDDVPAVAPLAEVAGALAAAGTPGVAVLRDLATRLRDQRGRHQREAAACLPARLTFPTALLLVPATVVAIGAPIVADGLAGLTGA